MKTVIGARASAILYNWLLSNNIRGRVLIPCNICESVPASYMKAGCDVVFCDIQKDNWSIDIEYTKQIIKKKGVQILHFNHTYGRITKEDAIFFETIKALYPNLIIVDDKCLCIPSFSNEKNADITLYSTGYSKYLYVNGGGYGCMTNKYNYQNHLKTYSKNAEEMFNKHVKECHTKHTPVDMNIMLSDWISFDFDDDSYFDRMFNQKEKTDKHKKIINEIYSEIPGSLPMEYNYWRYNILVENADECKKKLFDNYLFCSHHYMSLCNGYFSPEETPNANYLEKHVLNLFNDFCYTEEQAIKTTELLKNIAKPVERNI